MTNIFKISKNVKMSSLEISELVGSRHDDVKRSINRLADKGVIKLPPLAEVKNHLGQTVKVFIFDQDSKRDSYVVVAQLSPEFTARLVDRWQELEAGAKPRVEIGHIEALEIALSLAKDNEQLKLENSEMKPKAEFHDKVVIAPDAITIAEAAKVLGTGRNRLLAFLRQAAWVTRRNEPYQEKIESGCMDVKVGSFQHPDHGLKQSITPLITGKGLVKLEKLLTVKEAS